MATAAIVALQWALRCAWHAAEGMVVAAKASAVHDGYCVMRRHCFYHRQREEHCRPRHRRGRADALRQEP